MRSQLALRRRGTIGAAAFGLVFCGAAAAQHKDKWKMSIQTGAAPQRTMEMCVERDKPPFQMGEHGRCKSTEQARGADGARVWKLECEGGVTGTGRMRFSGNDAFEGESTMNVPGQTITTKMSGQRLGPC